MPRLNQIQDLTLSTNEDNEASLWYNASSSTRSLQRSVFKDDFPTKYGDFQLECLSARGQVDFLNFGDL